MALVIDFDIEVIFDLRDEVPFFVFNDNNDYAGEADTLVGGYITVTSPNGDEVYQTPIGGPADFLPGQLTLDTVSIPTTVVDRIVLGDYTFTYLAITVNNPTGFTVTKIFDYDFCSPNVEIETTIDLFSARFTSRDITDYSVGGVVPTNVRIHELHFPSALNKPELSNNSQLQEIFYPNFFEGTHTTIIKSALVYSYPNEFKIFTDVTGQKDTIVKSDINLCAIYCSVRSLKKRVDEFRCTNKRELGSSLETLNRVVGLMVLFEQATKCGEQSDADEYIQEIKDTLGGGNTCNGNCGTCGCSDGEEASQIEPFINSVIGSSGTNKWISTTGAPSNAEGNDGDFAIDKVSGKLYEKISGTWNFLLDTFGANGTNGSSSEWITGSGPPTAILGSDTDLYLDEDSGLTYKKVLGAWVGPIASLIGPPGATGPTGLTGSTGATGAAGLDVPIAGAVFYTDTLANFALDFLGGVGQDSSGAGRGNWVGWVHMDGSNHVLDSRGKFPAGYSELTIYGPNSDQADFNDIGKEGGLEFVGLGLNQIPAHEHDPTTANSATGITATTNTELDHEHDVREKTGGSFVDGVIDFTTVGNSPSNGDLDTGSVQPAGEHDHTVTISDPLHGHVITDKLRGGDGVTDGNVDDHENRPPYLSLPIVVKIA